GPATVSVQATPGASSVSQTANFTITTPAGSQTLTAALRVGSAPILHADPPVLLYPLRATGPQVLPVTAPAGTLTSSAPWVSIDSANAITIDPAGLCTGLNTATISGSSASIPVVAMGPPSMSASPANGSGASQTFTFTFSDPYGWRDLSVVNMLINSALEG